MEYSLKQFTGKKYKNIGIPYSCENQANFEVIVERKKFVKTQKPPQQANVIGKIGKFISWFACTYISSHSKVSRFLFCRLQGKIL